MNKGLLGIFSLALLIGTLTFGGLLPQAKITVRVLDERRNPVSGADVRATLQKAELNPQNWGTGRDNKLAVESTGSDGEATFEGYSDGELGGGVRKDGYYRGWWQPYKFVQRTEDRWQPWNPTVDVVLKQIVSPIAMYAHRVNRALPTESETSGFDLFVGDFVAPYGRGATADLTLKLEPADSPTPREQHKLVVSFQNSKDGLVPFSPLAEARGSLLKSPYNAPDSGYLPRWTVTRHQPETGASANYDPRKHGYFFRIRSVTDSSGKIVSANYGKIYGDFMNFTYYLNPTPNDRNIEFDPKRNLFTNLKPDERVTEP